MVNMRQMPALKEGMEEISKMGAVLITKSKIVLVNI